MAPSFLSAIVLSSLQDHTGDTSPALDMHSTAPGYLPAVLLTIVVRQPLSVESVVMSYTGSAQDVGLPIGFPLP
jgi:hypothetical protein